jgi:uncharacterized protein (DUF697 family)/GTPase SAR1 family protein
METVDMAKLVKEAADKADAERGRINILIAGRTGVGKSTLINSVFQGNLATTGQGKPVTKETREITKDGIPVSIFDTRGLETDKYKETLAALKSLVADRRNDSDIDRQIHAAWLCISEDSRRVEDAECELLKMLSDYMPVIVVITKARSDDGFKAEVQKLMPQAKNVVRVRSIAETLDEGIELMPMGLETLVDATSEVIPEGRRNAFAAAQKASLGQKKNRALAVISAATAAAVATGASPIPFSDCAILIPVQIGMLAGVSSVFGLQLSKGFLGTLVSSMIGTSAATIGGKAIVANLLKLIPGANVAGACISGATAGTLTAALGGLYVKTLEVVFSKTSDGMPSSDAIVAEFRNQLEKKSSD